MGGEMGKDIRFSTSVAVVVFILVSGFEIFGILVFDLGIGHVVADARV
jgi:hypothetical protein